MSLPPLCLISFSLCFTVLNRQGLNRRETRMLKRVSGWRQKDFLRMGRLKKGCLKGIQSSCDELVTVTANQKKEVHYAKIICYVLERRERFSACLLPRRVGRACAACLVYHVRRRWLQITVTWFAD